MLTGSQISQRVSPVPSEPASQGFSVVRPPAPLLTQATASQPTRTLDLAQAQAIAGELFKAGAGGWTGWGTDENTIVTTLAPLTAPEIALVSEEYGAAYPSSLKNDLIAEMDGDPTGIALMNALLKGKENVSEIQSLSIQAQMEGVYGDKAGAIAQLASMSPAERQTVADAYARRQGLSLSGQPARQHLSQAFQKASTNQAERHRFDWLILPPKASDGTEDWARGQTSLQANQLLAAFRAHDFKRVDTLLETIAPDQLPAIQKEFDSQVGQSRYAYGSRSVAHMDRRTLSQRIQQMPDKPSKHLFLLRLNPRPQDPAWQADLLNWQIDASLDGQNDVAQLHALLEAADPAILPLAQKRYDQTHPEPLATRLQNELVGTALDHTLQRVIPTFSGPPSHANWAKTQLLLTRPAVSDPRYPVWKGQFDAWTLVGAKDGTGADAERIKATLAANPEPEQKKRLDQNFRQITGQTLRQAFVPTDGVDRYTDVFAELGRRDQLKVDDLLRTPVDPKDRKGVLRRELDLRIAQFEQKREVSMATRAMDVIWPGYSIQKAQDADPLVRTEQLMRGDPNYPSSDVRLKKSLTQAAQAFHAGDWDRTERDLGLTALNEASFVETRDKASALLAKTVGAVAAIGASAGAATPLVAVGAGALAGGVSTAVVRAGTAPDEGDVIPLGIGGAINGGLMAVPMGIFGAGAKAKGALAPFKDGRMGGGYPQPRLEIGQLGLVVQGATSFVRGGPLLQARQLPGGYFEIFPKELPTFGNRALPVSGTTKPMLSARQGPPALGGGASPILLTPSKSAGERLSLKALLDQGKRPEGTKYVVIRRGSDDYGPQ